MLNPPAFPQPVHVHDCVGMTPEETCAAAEAVAAATHIQGISLRQFYAAFALAGVIAGQQNDIDYPDAASEAFDYADAMLDFGQDNPE